MSYRISKTAIIGPSFYMASLLCLFPYKFKKSDPGAPFRSSVVGIWAATVIWITYLSYSFNHLYWTAGIEKLFIIDHLHIFFAFFFPTFYSRNEIMHRLNASYLLLKQIKFSNNIIVPLLFIFSPFIAYVFLFVSFKFSDDHRWLSEAELVACLRFTATFTLQSSISSHCFATVFTIRDINRQLSHWHINHHTSTDLKALTKMLSCAYKQADLISDAFGPYLSVLISSNIVFVLVLFVKLRYTIISLNMLLTISVNSWSIMVLCASSQYMDYEATKLLELIKKLMFKTNTRGSEEHYKMLTLMMEETTLRKLLISVNGCFDLDLPLVLSLSNVIVTYLVILLELV